MYLVLMRLFPHGWPLVQCLQHESPPLLDFTISKRGVPPSAAPGQGVYSPAMAETDIARHAAM